MTQVGYDDIDEAVAVKIAKCRATAGARMEKRFPSNDPAELATGVPGQKRRLLVCEVPGCFLDVIQDVPLSDKKIFPAVVIVIDEFCAPAGKEHGDPGQA